ncbi:ATP-binding region ATPase domain protein [Gemmatirosa kalamazoonensis]|uniref:histidine kinase n=1 Tax=Gemmatirosa kalamazoonensis TaxID=861299 RepID=W0RPG7_9BACT|nr:HAMP domain-containing sensor histidine kinase [Gemmatirosa kalamazoonensis]AHG91378.1 ATP-binding region ATPase domain protein [Gemmatirosa kalamazoonensis]
MRLTRFFLLSLLGCLAAFVLVALATVGELTRAATRGAVSPTIVTRVEVAAQRGVLIAAIAAIVAAVLVTWLFRHRVARPLAAVRDSARALASADGSVRYTVHGDELTELARALDGVRARLGEHARARTVEADLLVALRESLSEGIVAVSASGTVVYVNDAARRLLDLKSPVPFSVDHLPRDRDLRETLREALAGQEAGPVELIVSGRHLALAAHPLADAAGAALTVFDLGPMRRLEAIRRDFVANVSHELKTPLTVVGGFAETLADDDVAPADRRRFAETIRVNAQRMQRIVDELLDLSRIESGGWRPMPERLDVATAAEEASVTARDAAAAKRVGFAVLVEPGAARAWADATALRQVLTNLVENAVRHTASGAVTVVARRDDTRRGVWIGVRDTGCGIEPEHLPRIFERFYRVDPARSREAGGTGLGLSIVKHLVEAHGGEVRATSAPGAGTTIEGFFPDAANHGT